MSRDEHSRLEHLDRAREQRAQSPIKVTVLSLTFRFEVVSMINADQSDMCNTYSALRSFTRDNSSPQQIKQRGYYMIDSSYTVPSDPNSMRDNGPLRNAEYYIADQADLTLK